MTRDEYFEAVKQANTDFSVGLSSEVENVHSISDLESAKRFIALEKKALIDAQAAYAQSHVDQWVSQHTTGDFSQLQSIYLDLAQQKLQLALTVKLEALHAQYSGT